MSIDPIASDRPLYWPEVVDAIRDALPNEDIYLVGGVVRDVYLRRPVHDIDLASATDGQPIARRIANAIGGDYYPLDSSRGVGRALIDWYGRRFTIDVAQFRGPDLLADLTDRDFTINALAAPLHTDHTIIDPTGGLADMQRKLVQLCSPDAINNDPLRMLRAVRLSLSHGFHLTPETKAAMRASLDDLSSVSNERIRDEFFKLLGGPRPHAAILLMQVMGILPIILPETAALQGVTQSPPHIYDVWRHTLAVVENMGQVLSLLDNSRNSDTAANFGLGMFLFATNHIRNELSEHVRNTEWPSERKHRALLILAALAHDIGKPVTRTVEEDGAIHFYRHEDAGATIVEAWGERLALSNDEVQRLSTIVFQHLRPAQIARNSSVTRRAMYRYWRDTGAAGVDTCLLAIADQLGKYGPTLQQAFWIKFVENIRVLLDGYFQEPDTLVNITPLVNGNTLMEALNMPPGPQLGELLVAMKEAQALNEISTRDEAMAWAKTWLADNTSSD